MRRRLAPWIAIAIVSSTPGWAQSPAGPEFQVNTYTTGRQEAPELAVEPDGDFVVVWTSEGQDGSSGGVFGQRFDAMGQRRGAEFQVNTYTTGYQSFPSGENPSVAAYAGGFVVVWPSFGGQDGDDAGIFGQRYDASGARTGAEFQVNVSTTSDQRGGAVSTAADGSFVVVWHSYGTDGSRWSIFGRRFNASGLPLGGEFRVNSQTPGDQPHPNIATGLDGTFVVAWENLTDGWSIHAQRFDSSANPLGGEFRVSVATTIGVQGNPRVTVAGNGSFVVLWEGGQHPLSAQRFDAAGTRLGAEIVVASPGISGAGFDSIASSWRGQARTSTRTAARTAAAPASSPSASAGWCRRRWRSIRPPGRRRTETACWRRARA